MICKVLLSQATALLFLCYRANANYSENWEQEDKTNLMMDLSTSCLHNITVDVFLPYRMGVADALEIIIADSQLFPNCHIKFSTDAHEVTLCMIVVVEFPDKLAGTANACQGQNTHILIKKIDGSVIDVCAAVNKKRLGLNEIATYFEVIYSSEVIMSISSENMFETVKITATAAKKVDNQANCELMLELQCFVAEKTICISKEFLCDGNINCGSRTTNDEDVRQCDVRRYQKLWLVVLCGAGMLIACAVCLIHLLRMYVPPVADSFFIFNENEDNKLILTSQMEPVPDNKAAEVHKSAFKFTTTSISTMSDKSMELPSKKPSVETEIKSHFFQPDEMTPDELQTDTREKPVPQNEQVDAPKSPEKPASVENIYKNPNFVQSTPNVPEDDNKPIPENEQDLPRRVSFSQPLIEGSPENPAKENNLPKDLNFEGPEEKESEVEIASVSQTTSVASSKIDSTASDGTENENALDENHS